MDRLLVAAVGLSAVGLSTLALLAYAVDPDPVPFPQLGRREGQRVCVEAVLAHVRFTDSGATRFILGQANASLGGWAPFPFESAPGDQVRVCGTLARDSGRLELRPESPYDVTVLRAWDEDAVSLAALAQRPWDFVGQNVVTWATVRDERSVPYLVQASSGARLRASIHDAPQDVLLRIRGLVEYDESISVFRLKVTSFEPVPGPLP